MSALNQAFLRAYTKDSRGARPNGAHAVASPAIRHSSPQGESVRHEPEPHVPEPHIPVSNSAPLVEAPASHRVPTPPVSPAAPPAASASVAVPSVAPYPAATSPAFDAGFDAPDQMALAAAFGAIHNVTAIDNLGDWTSLADTLNQHVVDERPAVAPPAPANVASVVAPVAAPSIASKVTSSAATRAPAAKQQTSEPSQTFETQSRVAVRESIHEPARDPVHQKVRQPVGEVVEETIDERMYDEIDEPAHQSVASHSTAAHAAIEADAQLNASAPSASDARLESRLHRVTASRPVFVAAWEVDAFQWPAGCDELLESCHDEFHLAAARFRTATIEGLRVLAVTSLLRREGRSTVAMALARAAAMEGIRVALLDADLDHPNLGSALGFQASVGWPDVLRENIPLAEAAVNSLTDRLTLFPLANPPRRWPMSLNTPEVSRLLRDLGQTFELVIVDLGPLAGPATRGFEAGEACPVDAALLVQDVRITTSDQARISAHGLRQAGIGAVGIIENFAVPVAAGHD